MPKYNLIEYGDNYSKTSGSLWQYYRDKTALTNVSDVANTHAANNSASCKVKQKNNSETRNGRAKNIEIMVPLIGNVLKPLAKSVLTPLGLIEAVSATDAAIHKKMFGSGVHPLDLAKQKTLIICNEEMNDIMKIVKSFQESGLSITSISETTKNEAKEQKGRLFGMLLRTLGDSLLGNLLTSKGIIRADEGTARVGYDV